MYIEELIKTTNAYKIISGEKKKDSLSHAYLLVCDDGEYMREYLKVFASLIQCDEDEPCFECRTCRLIKDEKYADCSIFPKEGTKILTEHADELVSESYIKPLENKTRVFILSNAENMNASSQNKILKTLEEPPQNVCILIGAVGDYNLLSTVKSRVKRIDISGFSEKVLNGVLSKYFPDGEKLKKAIASGNGKLSKIVKLYNNDTDESRMAEFCMKVLTEMKTSKDVLPFAVKIDKDNLSEFIRQMKEEVMKIIKTKRKGGFLDKRLDEYKIGALLGIEDLLTKKEKSIQFSLNVQMAVDSILFGILEEKYRWQKL